MPGSFHSILLHIVFPTEGRRPWLCAEQREEIFRYMAGILRDEGSAFVLVNGHVDHAHIVCSLPVTLAPGDLVRKLKACSSKWIRSTVEGLEDFRWQSGYAAFSFSRRQLHAVCRYVEMQEEHHRVKSFEEEYREFLEMAAIEYEEQFLFG